MSLRIIYGKSGSGKSKFCFDEIAKENLYNNTRTVFIYSRKKVNGCN